ncbi:restriction endonuclease [Sphingobacteriaceae bacterium]|nr:restriction endonuclease [Sphingobacteriaceae bacterium]
MQANKKIIFARGCKFFEEPEFKVILEELDAAIMAVTWGHESRFHIKPVRRGNGVVPIKSNFVKYLVSKGWLPEQRMAFTSGINPGPVDVLKKTSAGIFVVEWETGNISSSHRALNKIAIGIQQKSIIGGILILPDRVLANYLTDRIGNFEEIEPYFSLYESVVQEGIMGVYSVTFDSDEFDILAADPPLIPKGKDGNAKK